MAKTKKNEKIEKAEGRIVAVESALSKGEQFLEKNKNLLFYILLGIIVVIGGYFGYREWIKKPNELKAQANMFIAENYFGIDSLNLALNGDGTNMGFLDIIDEYGSTKAGNLANYYAGVIYMKSGQFEEAISYLEDFDSDSQIIGPMALGLTGDAYLELGDNQKALEYYMKAAERKDNDFTAPMYLMRAAWTCELDGDYTKALEFYEKIKKDHNRSNEARDIEKYIAHAKAQLGQ